MYLLYPFPADLDTRGAVDTRIIHYPARAVGADEEHDRAERLLAKVQPVAEVALECRPVEERARRSVRGPEQSSGH